MPRIIILLVIRITLIRMIIQIRLRRSIVAFKRAFISVIISIYSPRIIILVVIRITMVRMIIQIRLSAHLEHLTSTYSSHVQNKHFMTNKLVPYDHPILRTYLRGTHMTETNRSSM